MVRRGLFVQSRKLLRPALRVAALAAKPLYHILDRELCFAGGAYVIGSSVDLPCELDIPYRTYPSTSFPLSILAPQRDLTGLYATHYLNIAFVKNKARRHRAPGAAFVPRLRLDEFRAMSMLDVENAPGVLNRDNGGEALEWIYQSLSSGWYVYAHVDDFYLSETVHGNSMHFRHPCLIVGCCHPSNVFRGVTYLKGGEYGYTKVSPQSLLRSLPERRLCKPLSGDSYYKTFLCRTRPTDKTVRYDPTKAKLGLEDYLSSRSRDVRTEAAAVQDGPEWAYGVSTYRAYTDYVRSAVSSKSLVDVRDSRLIWEQKKIIRLNLPTWCRDAAGTFLDEVSADAEVVMQWAWKAHLKIVDYNRDRRTASVLSSHFDRVQEMETKEIETLNKIAAVI